LYGGPKAGTAADPLRTKRFFLAGIAVGVIAMSATGLAAARLIESPSQLAARSAAPAPAPITGVARMRVLRNAIVLAGTVRAGHTVTVTASAPYPTLIVTSMLARLGHRVWPGHVIVQVDGRPVLLLEGRLPAYRNLREGDAGPDVAQLQAALAGLGLGDYDPAGYFGPGTALAVQLLYQRLGYQPPLYRPPAKKHQPPGVPRPLPQVYLPMNEVSYIPTASALVIGVDAKAGTAVSPGQVVLRLATGHPYVTGMLTGHQATLARTGSAAQVALASPRIADAGVVTSISAVPAYASHGAGRIVYPVDVAMDRPLPEDLVGSTVRLTLWSTVTDGPALTVPLAAVFAAAPSTSGPAGRSAKPPKPYVTRITADGRPDRVPVDTGAMAGGFVTVQPTRPGALRPGDLVLIGISG
jgi:peptidoglycan hydrolase-like protein with peptidoglycan-binding domain